jgi:hypothetical protein
MTFFNPIDNQYFGGTRVRATGPSPGSVAISDSAATVSITNYLDPTTDGSVIIADTGAAFLFGDKIASDTPSYANIDSEIL